MNQFRRNSLRSWNVALIVTFSVLFGCTQTRQAQLLAQYPGGANPFPYSNSPPPSNRSGYSPYGAYQLLPTRTTTPNPAQPAVTPQPTVAAQPMTRQATVAVQPAVPVQPTVPEGPVTTEPPLMEQSSPVAESSGNTASTDPNNTPPTMAPIALGGQPAGDAASPVTEGEPPLGDNPAPVAVEPTPVVSSPAPAELTPPETASTNNTPVVSEAPATAETGGTEESTVQAVGLTVASPGTTTESEKPTALATTVTDTATPAPQAGQVGSVATTAPTPGPAVEKSKAGESPAAAKQTAAASAPANPGNPKEALASPPAVANEGNGAATASAQPGATPDSEDSIITAKQLLIALLVAIALGASTGIWAMIVLARRQGGSLPSETIELINQTLQVYCDHLTSGPPAQAAAPATVIKVRKRRKRQKLTVHQVPGTRTAADPRARDDIVQNILMQNRILRDLSDTDIESETGSDSQSDSQSESQSESQSVSSESESKAEREAPSTAGTLNPTESAPGVIQVVWDPYPTVNRSR